MREIWIGKGQVMEKRGTQSSGAEFLSAT